MLVTRQDEKYVIIILLRVNRNQKSCLRKVFARLVKTAEIAKKKSISSSYYGVVLRIQKQLL